MFYSLKHITDKAADALDLAIELVTLGEYGLEYPDAAMPEAIELHRSAPAADCGRRSRQAAEMPRSGRNNRRPAEPSPRKRRRPAETSPSHPSRPPSPADIIRTPRIQPDWTYA